MPGGGGERGRAALRRGRRAIDNRGAMWRMVIGLVIGVAACTPTLADQATEVCYPLCRCNDVPLPAEQRDCTASCLAQLEQHPPSDTCVQCVAEHGDRCTRLLDDCTPICTQATEASETEARLER